jgi:hypothetical protein
MMDIRKHLFPALSSVNKQQITDHGSLITDHWLPITDHWLPITDHWLPITGYRLLFTSIKTMAIAWSLE